jgi:hypothetical protein
MATDRTPADDQSGTLVLVAFATKMGATAGIAAMIAEELSSLAAALQSRTVQLFQSGPCAKDAVDPDRPEPANIRQRRGAIGADAPIILGGMLDPATTRGFLAKRMAHGELAGDFRDRDRVRWWAASIATSNTSANPALDRQHLQHPLRQPAAPGHPGPVRSSPQPRDDRASAAVPGRRPRAGHHPVGAENRATASDQGLPGQPTSQSPLADRLA